MNPGGRRIDADKLRATMHAEDMATPSYIGNPDRLQWPVKGRRYAGRNAALALQVRSASSTLAGAEAQATERSLSDAAASLYSSTRSKFRY